MAPYMDLIAAGDATAQQIAAFGNFLGQGGRNEAALAYYDLALSIDDEDPTIWLNAGTLHRQIGDLQAAAGAYSEALSLDPDHAYAHYNLGAVLDEIMDLLGCFRDDVCLCDEGPDCLSLDIVNETETDIKDVMLKVCVGSTCRVLPGDWPSWPSDTSLTVSIPHDFDVPLSWRSGTSKAPLIQPLSLVTTLRTTRCTW